MKKTILAWPKTCPNPYTKILYEEFENQNIKVLSHRDNRLAGILNKVDYFHFHWLGSFLDQKMTVSFFATFAYMIYIKTLKIKRTKLIWTLHNSLSFTHSKNNKWLEKILVPFLFRNVDKLIIHSKFQQEHIPKEFHHKIIHILHQNYCSTFNKKEFKKENYFLFFGTVSPYKGLENAIIAYKNAKKENSTLPFFKIIGKSNSLEYQNKIEQLIGDENSIIFENRYIEDSELEILVKKAKAVILPYEQITNSGSLIYALSCRTNVVIKKSLLTNELFDNFPELINVVKTFETSNDLITIMESKFEINQSIFSNYITRTNVENIIKIYINKFNLKKDNK